jgi:hypothetical protein
MQQLFEEALGSGAVPSVLNQNIEHDAVLIHRAPQIVQHSPDAMNTSPRCQVSPGFGRRRRSRPAKLAPNFGHQCRMGHHDAAFSQDQLHVAQAQAEDVIQPHSVVDDLGWKPVPG